jgi:hypothetical protein
VSDRRHQMRKAFHGPVLRDISLQVWVPQANGTRVRYSPAAWKLLLAQLFAVPLIEERGQVVDVRHSTEALTDEEFPVFLLQSQAFAAMELGVEFTDVARQS